MRKGLLLLLLILSLITAHSQTATRLKSWGYLESPPSPQKAFSTNVGALELNYVYPNYQLLKLNTDGSLSKLANLRKSSNLDKAEIKQEGNWAMIAYSESDSVFFYLTDGTAAKTKLIYSYRGSGSVHQFDFVLHKTKAYIAYDTGWNAFKGLVEINTDDFKSKVLFNKASEDIKIWSVVSNGENLFLNYSQGTTNTAYQVNTTDGTLTSVTSNLAYWLPQRPFQLMGNTLAMWTVKDTTVSMNGTNFQTKRMLLQKYNTSTKSFETLLYAGYFQAPQPWYLGEIAGKHYFFSNGDFNLKNCNATTCQGNTGAYLWEVTTTGKKLVKSATVAGETYTYAGIKQVASDKIYLEIATKAAGKELWVASPTNLYMVKDHIGTPSVLKDYGLKLNEAVVCGGKIAIPGVGAMAQTGNDYELYISDGTLGNLNKLDVMPKAGVQSNPKGLVTYLNKVYFVAADTIKDNLGIAKTSLFSIELCNAGPATSVESFSYPSELKIFPNPAKDKLNLQISEAIENLEIWNTNGELILRKNNPEKQLDISQLKNGLYQIRAMTNRTILSGKFVVVR